MASPTPPRHSLIPVVCPFSISPTISSSHGSSPPHAPSILDCHCVFCIQVKLFMCFQTCSLSLSLSLCKVDQSQRWKTSLYVGQLIAVSVFEWLYFKGVTIRGRVGVDVCDVCVHLKEEKGQGVMFGGGSKGKLSQLVYTKSVFMKEVDRTGSVLLKNGTFFCTKVIIKAQLLLQGHSRRDNNRTQPGTVLFSLRYDEKTVFLLHD